MDGSSLLFVDVLNLVDTKRNRSQGPRFCGKGGVHPCSRRKPHGGHGAVAVLHGAHTVIDNRPSNMMFVYEPATTVWKALRPKRFWALFAAMPLFSEALRAQVLAILAKLMGNRPWVQRLACKCMCPRRKHVPLNTVKIVKGVRKVTGSKLALKASTTYPTKFGIAVINAWMSNCEVNQLV